MPAKLLSCPLCKDKAFAKKLTTSDNSVLYAYIQCCGCGLKIIRPSMPDVIRCWNTRAGTNESKITIDNTGSLQFLALLDQFAEEFGIHISNQVFFGSLREWVKKRADNPAVQPVP